MSTLKVANVHFESTGANRIDYLNDSILRITPGIATSITSGNLLVGRTTDSTIGYGVKLDVNGAINASAILVNGTFFSPKVNSSTSFGTPLAWNSDLFNQYAATAQAADVTLSADSGSPVDGQKVIFRFLDSGSTRTLTFTGGASKAFKPVSVTLTTSGSNFTYATTANKTVYFGCIYNASSSRWEIVAQSIEA